MDQCLFSPSTVWYLRRVFCNEDRHSKSLKRLTWTKREKGRHRDEERKRATQTSAKVTEGKEKEERHLSGTFEVAGTLGVDGWSFAYNTESDFDLLLSHFERQRNRATRKRRRIFLV